MQKVQSYLYPNRIILLADLAGFTVENTIVYAKTVKIYQGVDNVIEFDIQNADQKRLELVSSPNITQIQMVIMDSAGNKLPNSPYTVTPSSTIKGIGTVVIPQGDVVNLKPQFLRYSVTALKNGNTIPLYADSRFGMAGSIELIGNTMPVSRAETVYNRFSGEIDFKGNVINHTSAIPCKFYEAVPTSAMTFEVTYSNYTGEIYIEGTKDSSISVESFSRQGVKLVTFTPSVHTGTLTQTFSLNVGDYNYFRVSWTYMDPVLIGVNSVYPTGTVDKVVAY
jgi:hypothetical protein